ncbi:MAG TPA: hypothetical protein VK644_04020 [Chitinophagaceae bacterium]|nr:hypothetical protein [Chitinophagaceae bacterium]
MKKIVKSLFFSAFAFALTLPSFSQKLTNAENTLAADLKKVIRDYPHQFAHLRGNMIEETPQTASYECTLELPGAETSSITKYSAKKENIYSWQAIMLTTESFDEAKKKFRSLYSQLNNLTVKMDYGETFYLKGKYAVPVEEKNFTSAVFSFQDADQLTYKMKVEVSMQYELLEWKVRLLVYDHERDDAEQGEQVE